MKKLLLLLALGLTLPAHGMKRPHKSDSEDEIINIMPTPGPNPMDSDSDSEDDFFADIVQQPAPPTAPMSALTPGPNADAIDEYLGENKQPSTKKIVIRILPEHRLLTREEELEYALFDKSEEELSDDEEYNAEGNIGTLNSDEDSSDGYDDEQEKYTQKPPTKRIKSTSSPKKNYICTECQAALASKQSLKRHIEAKHERERHHKYTKKKKKICTECGKECHHNEDLKTHMRKEHGAEKIKCPYDGCNKAFNSQNSLDTHINKHKGLAYTCTQDGCDRTFTTPSGVFLHVKREHKGRKFSCPYEECTQVPLTVKSKMQAHIHNKHEGVGLPIRSFINPTITTRTTTTSGDLGGPADEDEFVNIMPTPGPNLPALTPGPHVNVEDSDDGEEEMDEG